MGTRLRERITPSKGGNGSPKFPSPCRNQDYHVPELTFKPQNSSTGIPHSSVANPTQPPKEPSPGTSPLKTTYFVTRKINEGNTPSEDTGKKVCKRIGDQVVKSGSDDY
jgi:hypothetical protein